MQPRLTLVTLGVADLARAQAFYEAWGWKASSASQLGEVAFFQANGLALALFGRAALAADAHIEDSAPGFSGISLAYNCRSRAEADAVFARVIAAGARLLKPPQDAAWGGYSGYFADPDGHLWEVAWNPFFPLDDEGHLFLPDTRQ
jgi:catechol 2,3-dioxygenase-like lactoylglutathione lyase family enzyme